MWSTDCFPPLRAIQYIVSLGLPLHRMRLLRLSGRLRRPPVAPRFYEHRLSVTVSPFGRKRDVDRLASVLSRQLRVISRPVGTSIPVNPNLTCATSAAGSWSVHESIDISQAAVSDVRDRVWSSRSSRYYSDSLGSAVVLWSPITRDRLLGRVWSRSIDSDLTNPGRLTLTATWHLSKDFSEISVDVVDRCRFWVA
jgi:hypothetical protein